MRLVIATMVAACAIAVLIGCWAEFELRLQLAAERVMGLAR